jgi:hypothetical protein
VPEYRTPEGGEPLMGEHAYRTAEVGTINAYRTALACTKARGKKIQAGLAELGVSPDIYVRSSGFPGDRMRLTELVPIGDVVPDGWRLMKSTGRLEPRRGKTGEAARQWLAEHQPIDVRHVMEENGLPRAAWIPGDGFGYRIVSPQFFEHDGALWARYAAEPGTSGSGFDNKPCTWEPIKLSEFYAAYETNQASEDGGDSDA